jgi:hypothetical protein
MSAPPTEQREVGPAGRGLLIVLWSAFLAAAVGTMVCFAFLDPAALANGDPPGWWPRGERARLQVYAIGFFFFWLVGIVAAVLSRQLAKTPGASR